MTPPPRQPGRAAGHGQAQHVRQVVAGVGHQGGGVGQKPGRELADDEGQVDDQADGVAPVAGIGRAVMVMAAQSMAVAMRMAVSMGMTVVVVSVIVRHVPSSRPGPAARSTLADRNSLNVNI
ncbi:hypothetical protein D3C77_188590 [compost metagenome]